MQIGNQRAGAPQQRVSQQPVQQQQQQQPQQEEQQQQGGWNLSWVHYIMIFMDLKVKIVKNDEVLQSWYVQDLQYNYDEKNYINKTFSLTQEQIYSEPYPYVTVSIRNKDNGAEVHTEGELVIVQEKITKEQLQNLVSSANDDIPQPKTKSESKKGEKVPHFRQRFYIQLSHDTNSYHPQQIPPQLKDFIKLDRQTRQYSPLIDTKQFWVRRKDTIYQGQLEEDLKKDENHLPTKVDGEHIETEQELQQMELMNYNTTIVFYPYWYTKILLVYQLEEAFKTQNQFGLNDQNSMEQLKEILGDNNPYYLGVTFFVSMLHSLFELLAVKNDISYWRNLENYQGLSLRSLYTGFFFEIIIFLYLLDSQETSWLILVSAAIELVVTVWKIYKTAKCQRRKDNKFPFFEIDQTQQTYVRTTEEYDRQATKYLYYALVPLLVGYTIYSLIYLEHKGWYSFIISTLVGFIYLFGFINMTPQLYINYKLKSVEHLPWRTMIYKFLNTIVDDLFAFVISMPWLKRLSCFRDDIIFLIYIYQRHIYKVDHKRTQHGFKKEDVVPAGGASAEENKKND